MATGRDPKIASLEEARRRARQGKRPGGEGSGGGGPHRPRGNLREWVIGGVIVLMALGMLAAWIAPLIGVSLTATGAR